VEEFGDKEFKHLGMHSYGVMDEIFTDHNCVHRSLFIHCLSMPCVKLDELLWHSKSSTMRTFQEAFFF
jgi:hypothetical protein